jgi:hypothetical protein
MSSWRIEADDVAAELIRSGVPPWQAIERATEIVRERRQREARKAKADAQ